MWAARKGHSDVIKVLLDAGAAIEAKDKVSKRISICTCESSAIILMKILQLRKILY